MAAELVSTGAAEPPPLSAAPPAPPPPPAISNRFTLPPIASFAEVSERPLFSPSRRPNPVETRPNADQPLTATLAGIVISSSSRGIIVAHGDPPTLTRLKEGDDLDGWSVRSIQPDRVVLRRGSEERQLKLHDAPGQAADDASPSRPGSAGPLSRR